jgi:hypothetical protein
MNGSSFHLDAAFLAELRRRLLGVEHRTTSGWPQGALRAHSATPSEIDLRTLIEGAFWASLRKDEGHEVTFVLSYEEPDHGDGAFVFLRPIPFEPYGLARLAPAIHDADARLGVWHGASGGLEVWGYTSIQSGAFGLTALEPGNLVVTYGAANVGAVFGSRAVFVDATCLMPGCPIWTHVFGENRSEDTAERACARKTASVLEVARSMRWHSRGGTLLLVPLGDGWRASLHEPLLYEPARGASRARAVLPHVEEPHRATRDTSSLPTLRMHGPTDDRRLSLRSIARLTAVDGATVLTSDLEVAVFGAKIRALNADTRPETVVVHEPVEGAAEEEVLLARLGNTRHLSAAQFVFDQRSAVAVVVSQDRVVTILSWDEGYGKVRAIRHAELVLQ